MPTYRVHGFGRDNGRKRSRKIDAASEDDAIHRAADFGIVVERTERLPDPPPEPATDPQRSYARDLGLKLPAGCTKALASAMITCHQEDIHPPPGLSADQLYDLIRQKHHNRDLHLAYRWIVSIIRHRGKQRWVLPSDIPANVTAAARQLAPDIVAEPQLLEQIGDQDVGHFDQRLESDIDDRDLESHGGFDDFWFCFGKDGSSSRCKAFTFVTERINLQVDPSTTKRGAIQDSPDAAGCLSSILLLIAVLVSILLID